MKDNYRKAIEITLAVAVGVAIGFSANSWWKKTQEQPPTGIGNQTVNETTINEEVANNLPPNNQPVNNEEEKEENNNGIGGNDEISADYTNTSNNFALNLPDGWQVIEKEKEWRAANKEDENASDFVSVDIFAREKLSSETAKDYYTRVYPNFSLQSETENNGLTAFHFIDDSGYIAGEEITVFASGNNLFELHNNLAGSANFNAVVNSFQIF